MAINWISFILVCETGHFIPFTDAQELAGNIEFSSVVNWCSYEFADVQQLRV